MPCMRGLGVNGEKRAAADSALECLHMLHSRPSLFGITHRCRIEQRTVGFGWPPMPERWPVVATVHHHCRDPAPWSRRKRIAIERSASSTVCLSPTRCPLTAALAMLPPLSAPITATSRLQPRSASSCPPPPTRCCTSHSGKSPSSARPTLFAWPCRLSSRLRRRCGWRRRR